VTAAGPLCGPGRGGGGCAAAILVVPASGRGRPVACPLCYPEGPAGVPGSRAARRAMRSTLEAGVADPYP
jgi:hypothetical protein